MEPTACSYSQGKATLSSLQQDNLPTKNSHTCNPRVAVFRDGTVLSNSDALPLDLSSMKNLLAERDMIANKLQKPASDTYSDYLLNSICNKLPETKNDLTVNYDSFSCNSGLNHSYPEGTKFSRCNPQLIAPSKLYYNEGKDLQLPYDLEKVCDTPNFTSYSFSPICTKTGILTPNQETNDSRSFCDSGYNSFSVPNSNRTKFTVRSTPTLEPRKDCLPTCKVPPCINLDSDFDNPELLKDHLPTHEAPLCITLDSDSDFSDVEISAEDFRKELSSQDEDALLNMNFDLNKPDSNILSAVELRGESSEAVQTNTGSKNFKGSSTKDYCCKFSTSGTGEERSKKGNHKGIANSGPCKDDDSRFLYLDEYMFGKIDLDRAKFAASALRLWSEVQTSKCSPNNTSNLDMFALKSNNCDIVASSRKKSSSSLKKRARSKGKRKSKIDDPDIETSPLVHWSVKIDERAVDLGKPVKLTFKRQLLPEVSPSPRFCSINEDCDSIRSSFNKPISSIKNSASADSKARNKVGSPGISVSSTVSQSPDVNVSFYTKNVETPVNLTVSKKSQQTACPSSNLSVTETKTSSEKLPQIVPVSRTETLSEKPPQIICPSSSLPLTETQTLSKKPQQVACPNSNSPMLETKTLSKKPQQLVCPSSNPLVTEAETLSKELQQIVRPSSSLPMTETKTLSKEPQQVTCPSSNASLSEIKTLNEKPQQLVCPSINLPVIETETLSEKAPQIVCPSSSLSVTGTKPFSEKPQQLVCSSANLTLLVTNDCDKTASFVEKASSPKNVIDPGCKLQDQIDSRDTSVSFAVSEFPKSNTSAGNQRTPENLTSNEPPQKTFSSSNVHRRRQKYVRVEAVEDCDIPICFSGPATSSSKNSQTAASKAKKKIGNSDISVSDGHVSVSQANSPFLVSNTSCEIPVNLKKKPEPKISLGSNLSLNDKECNIVKKLSKNSQNLKSHSAVSQSDVSNRLTENCKTPGDLIEKPQQKVSSGSDSFSMKGKELHIAKKSSKEPISSLKNHSVVSQSDASNMSTENCETPENLAETPRQKVSSGSGLFPTKDQEHNIVKKSSKKSIFRLKNFIMKKSSKTLKNFITKKSSKKKIRDKVNSLDILSAVSRSPKSSICTGSLETPVNQTSSGKLQRVMGNIDSDSDENSSISSTSSLKNSKSADGEAKNKNNEIGNFVISSLPPSVVQSFKRTCVVNLGTRVQLNSSGKPVLKVSPSSKSQSTKTEDCEIAESSSIKHSSNFKNFVDSKTKCKKNEISRPDLSIPAAVSQSFKANKSLQNEGTSVYVTSSEKSKHKVCPSSNVISKKDKASVLVEISSKKPTSSLEKIKSADSKIESTKNEIISPDTGLSPPVPGSAKLNTSVKKQVTPMSANSNEKSKHQMCSSSDTISTIKEDSVTVESSSKKPTLSLKISKSIDSGEKSKKKDIGGSDISVLPTSKSNASADNQGVPKSLTSNKKPEQKVIQSSGKTLTKNKDSATVGSSSKKPSSSLKSDNRKAKIKKNDGSNSAIKTSSSNESLQSKPSKPSKSAMFTENFGKPIILTVNKKPPKKIQVSSNLPSKKDGDGDNVKSPSENATSSVKDTKIVDETKNKKDDAGSVLPATSCDVAVFDASLKAKLGEVSKSDKSQVNDLESSSTKPTSCDKSKTISTSAPTEVHLKEDSSADKCSSNSSYGSSKPMAMIDAEDKDIADNISANLSSCTSTNSKTTTHVLNSSAVAQKGEIFSNPNLLVIEHLEKSIEELVSISPLQVKQVPADTNVDECINSDCLPEKTTHHPETVGKVPNLSTESDTQSLNVNLSAPARSASLDSDTVAQDSGAADVSKDSSLLKPKLSLADYLGRSNTQSKNRVSVDSDSSTDSCSPYSKSSDRAGADDKNSTTFSRKKSDRSHGGHLSVTASHSFVNNEILTDTSFEKVVSDASKKLSSPFSSKFLSSVRTLDKQASGVPNAELSKIILSDDNINNNYKTSCTEVASPDKVLSDQQKAKISDSMSPKTISEDIASKTEAQVNTTPLKSPSSEKLAFGMPEEKSNESVASQKNTLGVRQEKLSHKTLAHDISSNSNVVVKKRPLTGVSSNLKPTKVPREIKKRRRKLKWLLRKIDFETPKEETLSSKFCRLGLILPNEKSPKTTSAQENTSSSTDSLLKNCDSKLKSLLPEKSELVRGLDNGRTIQSDKRKIRDNSKLSSCIRSRRDPRLAGVLAKEKKSPDLSLNPGDVNNKLQEALNICKLALKRKCDTVVCERKNKNFKADSTSQDGSVTDNPGTSCDESKDSPHKKSSLFNKLIELNSPKMPRERVITLDESSSEDSDDDSILSLTTSDILPNDKAAAGIDIDNKPTDTTVEGDITNKTVDIDVTNKTIDIDISNRTIDIDITNNTIDINESVATDVDKETGKEHTANEVVDMDISQSPTYDDVRKSPNCMEGLEPAEFYKSKCDSKLKRDAGLDNCMHPQNSISNRYSPNHQRECLFKHKLSAPNDLTQAGLDCLRQDRSSAAKSSVEVPSMRSKSPDFEAYQSVLPQHGNFSKYQSYLPSVTNQSANPTHSVFSPFVDHFDVEPLEKSDFFENHPDYLKPSSDWHYVDNADETSSKRCDTDNLVHNGNFEIAFGQPPRTVDLQTSGNSLGSPFEAVLQPTDQSVPSLSQNDDDMDLSPGVDGTPLLPNDISCSRIPLPGEEISYSRDPLLPNEISSSRISPPEEEIPLSRGPLPPDEISFGRDPLPENEVSCSRIPLPEREISFGRIPLPENEISFGRIPLPENEISFGRIPLPENEISFGNIPSLVEEELLRENETGSANVGAVGIGSELRNETECRSWLEPAFEVAEPRSDLVFEIPASVGGTSEAPPSEVFESNDDGIKEAEKLDHLNPAWDFWRKLDNDKDRYRGVRMAWKNSRIPNPKLNLTIRNSQRRNGFAPPASEMEGPNDNSVLPTIPCETVFMDQVAENLKKYDEKIDALQDSMEYELQTQTLNHENTIRNCPNPSAIPEIKRLHFMALRKTREFFEKQRDDLIMEKEANDLRLKTACNLVVSFHRFYDNLDGEKPVYGTRLTLDEYEEVMEVNKILELYNTFYK